MKRYLSLFIAGALLAGYAHPNPSPSPSPDLVRQYAQELGVPAEALQQLVDAYRPLTGLTDPNVKGAATLTLRELLIMRDENLLKPGNYYRVKTVYNYQTGKRVILGDAQALSIDADFTVIFQRYSPVEALFQANPDRYSRGNQLILVELALAE
jgi:hypothetical protein